MVLKSKSQCVLCALPQVRVDFTTKAASRSASLAQASEDGAIAGAPAAHGQELASPPTADALEALDALVAAAGYAGTHGTPAIQAALAGTGGGAAAAAAIAAAGLPGGAGLPGTLVHPGFDLPTLQPAAPPKRRRTSQMEGGGAAELLLQQQEQQLLLARRQSAANWRPSGGWPRAAPAAPAFSLAEWQPSEPHVQMYQAIQQILAGHQWTPEEQASLQRFRWAVRLSCGMWVCGPQPQ